MSDNVVVELLSTAIDEVLPENILNIDTKSVKCFLCNRLFVTGDESFLLFNERIQNDGSFECPLAHILSAALDLELNETTAHSTLLCCDCNAVVLEYESLEQKLTALRLNISNAYNTTILRLEVVDENTKVAIAATELEQREVLDESCNGAMAFVGEVAAEQLSVDATTSLNEHTVKLTTVKGGDFTEQAILLYEGSGSDSGSLTGTPVSINTATLSNEHEIEEFQTTPSVDNVADFPLNTTLQQSEQYLCSLCDNDICLDAKAFTDHMYAVHELRFYPCELCTNTFESEEELNEHIDQVHETIVPDHVQYECDLCDCYFVNNRLLRLHKRTHNADEAQSHVCGLCQQKLNSKTDLEAHIKKHYSSRPFQCEQCTKQFSTKSSLHAHLKIHGERQRNYKCNICEKTFYTPQNLQHHKKVHTNEKLFACAHCPKMFATQHNLDAHIIVHSGKRPHICKICGKSFARRAEIIDHERIHTGLKPFKCDLCDMAFAQRSNLSAHKKTTHLNEKLHKCDLCNRSFKRRRLLDYHTQAVHTGERPYKCDLCDSSFVYPEHYKKHQRIHTGVKPFACEVCGKCFNSRDNRNAHRFVHSDKKPYECMQCGAGFMRKPLLLAHMKHTRHINNTIIVNQPQITGGQIQTTTSIAADDLIATDYDELESNIDSVDEPVDDVDAAYEEAFDGILSQAVKIEDTDNDDNDDDGSGGTYATDTTTVKNKISDVQYLQFDDFDATSQQALTWSDLTGDKH